MSCPYIATSAVEKLLRSSTTDITFLSLMIAHHRQAIKHSTHHLRLTNSPIIEGEILEMISTQSHEIDQMLGLLRRYGQGTPILEDSIIVESDGCLMEMMGTVTDSQFVKKMIIHHQVGVQMAIILRLRSTHPEVRQLAEETMNSQQDQIERFIDFLDI